MNDVTADMARETMTLLDLFFLGKWAMWPLLIFSIATISLVIERVIFLLSHNLSIKNISAIVLGAINNGTPELAVLRCQSSLPGVISNNVMKLNILKHLEPETEQELFLSLYEKNNATNSYQLITDPLVTDVLNATLLLQKKGIIASDNELAAEIINEGLTMIHLENENIEKAMSSRAGATVNTLERGFNFLIALGSLAPITGFLGTVSGMISAFQSIAKAADVNAQLIAGGIFEALITTAYGLAIAILAITGYNILSHIVDTFTTRMEDVGSQIINAITLSRAR